MQNLANGIFFSLRSMKNMNELALELNKILEGSVVDSFLSPLGRRMYFPKGIVAQAAEAKEKAKLYNATAGLATSHGVPMHIREIMDCFKDGIFTPADIFSYAPGGGDKALRNLWKEDMERKNPTLRGKKTSTPLVTAGLTHAISMVCSMFISEGEEIVVPDLYWDNYQLIIEDKIGGVIKTFQFFDGEGFNVKGMKAALLSTKGDTARILLNFPNNPTGYTPSKEEMGAIAKALKEVAKEKKVLVISDDAYYGLFFEDVTEKESLFSYIADADENILAVKGDAATKEEMVWGFRVGFVTFASKGLSDEQIGALTNKFLGLIRCTVSNCDRPGQSMLVKAMKENRTRPEDKKTTFSEMGERYQALKDALKKYEGSKLLKPYPFNSGYFMAFDTFGRSAEELRAYLLDKYSAGVINILGSTVRVAYCSVEKEKIPALVDLLYKAAGEIWN